MGSDYNTSLNGAPWMYLANGATDPIYENRLAFLLGKLIQEVILYKYNIY